MKPLGQCLHTHDDGTFLVPTYDVKRMLANADLLLSENRKFVTQRNTLCVIGCDHISYKKLCTGTVHMLWEQDLHWNVKYFRTQWSTFLYHTV